MRLYNADHCLFVRSTARVTLQATEVKEYTYLPSSSKSVLSPRVSHVGDVLRHKSDFRTRQERI